jgi:hypothetical protein
VDDCNDRCEERKKDWPDEVKKNHNPSWERRHKKVAAGKKRTGVSPEKTAQTLKKLNHTTNGVLVIPVGNKEKQDARDFYPDQRPWPGVSTVMRLLQCLQETTRASLK